MTENIGNRPSAENANDIFYRYAPFIQDFIYKNSWAELRGVQLRSQGAF